MNIKDWFMNKAEEYRAARANMGYTCDACGREVFSYPERRLCDKCLDRIEFNDGLTCPKCGRKTLSEGVCLSCKAYAPVFEKGLSPLVYARGASGLINRFKNGQRHLAYFFADECAKTLDSYTGGADCAKECILVAVPLTEDRREERGFNQSEELAKAIAEKTGIPYFGDVLFKLRETAAQKDLDSNARRRNVSGAYRVNNKAGCREKTVVLIDDVMTTSATGNECAGELLKAGAKRVILLTATSLRERK